MKVELRYGNLIQHGSDYYTVKEIRDYSIEAQHTDGTSEPTTLIYPDIARIPLTEEWLLNFGFKITHDFGDQKTYQHPSTNKFSVEHDHEDWAFIFETKQGYHTIFWDDKAFQFVHQLQNLYFVLTGEELTLTQTHNK